MFYDTQSVSGKVENSKRGYVIGRSESSFLLLDNFFIMGIVFAPMTALRIFKFGPGEILLIIWMFAVFMGSNPSTIYPPMTLPMTIIGRYQRANLIMMMLGLMVNFVFYNPTLSRSAIITDLFSHLFMLLFSACMYLYLEQRAVEDINKIIRSIVVRGVIVYGAILYYALNIGNVLLGTRLWLGGRGGRFMGLALNPHQIGMITGPGICLALYLMTQEKSKILKILYIGVAYFWYIISLSLKSDTLTVTYVILVAIAMALIIPAPISNPNSKKVIFSIIMFLGVIALIATLPFLWNQLADFVMGAGNGAGRLELWNAGLGQFKDKIICLFTGLGPGGNTGMYMVVSGNQMEAHNTYVQQILNSGIFIYIYYIYVIINLIKNPIEKNPFLILSVIYFVLYGFGGNMNRRILVWFTYTLVLVLTERKKNSEIIRQ